MDPVGAPQKPKADAEIELYVGRDVFAAILESYDGNTSTVLMDGQVRVGSAVTLRQKDMRLSGRVRNCESLGCHSGHRLTIVPGAGPEPWNAGSERPIETESASDAAAPDSREDVC